MRGKNKIAPNGEPDLCETLREVTDKLKEFHERDVGHSIEKCPKECASAYLIRKARLLLER